jgi:tetratricopeptide (TPR) repeat protein
LEIKTKVKGKDSIEVATTLDDIGCVYDSKKDYKKALKFYKKCLEIRIKIQGRDSTDVATNLHAIGTVYHSTGKLDKAMQYYNMSL